MEAEARIGAVPPGADELVLNAVEAEIRTGADATGADNTTWVKATGAKASKDGKTASDAELEAKVTGPIELYLGLPSIFRVTDGHFFQGHWWIW
jgi:hypothetical protein